MNNSIQISFKKLIKLSYSTGGVAAGLFHVVRISHLVVSVFIAVICLHTLIHLQGF